MSDRAGERGTACGSGRAGARAALEGALGGVALTPAERRFLGRVSGWDKRSAGMIASLLERARQRGRLEASLPPRQRAIMLAALMDACAYRTSNARCAGCWQGQQQPGGRCAEHARDARLAAEFAQLAALLGTGPEPVTGLRDVASPAAVAW